MNLITKARARIARKRQLHRTAQRESWIARSRAMKEGFDEAIRMFGAKPEKESGIVYLNEPPQRTRIAVGVPGAKWVQTVWFEVVQHAAEFDCITPCQAVGEFGRRKTRVRWFSWKLSE